MGRAITSHAAAVAAILAGVALAGAEAQAKVGGTGDPLRTVDPSLSRALPASDYDTRGMTYADVAALFFGGNPTNQSARTLEPLFNKYWHVNSAAYPSRGDGQGQTATGNRAVISAAADRGSRLAQLHLAALSVSAMAGGDRRRAEDGVEALIAASGAVPLAARDEVRRGRGVRSADRYGRATERLLADLARDAASARCGAYGQFLASAVLGTVLTGQQIARDRDAYLANLAGLAQSFPNADCDVPATFQNRSADDFIDFHRELDRRDLLVMPMTVQEVGSDFAVTADACVVVRVDTVPAAQLCADGAVALGNVPVGAELASR